MSVWSQMPPEVWTLMGLVLGLMAGSFANVCIVRLPEERSVVFPPSHCPSCETPIRAYDNIPVLSYLVLKGRCRACGRPISPLYPVVEAVTGLLMAAVFWRFGVSWACLIFAWVIPALVVITVIDIQHQIIPDKITLPGIVFGVAAGWYLNGWVDTLIGLVLGSGLFTLLAEVWLRARGIQAMGGGDIKYIAAAGALLGWQQVLLIIFLASLLGGVFGVLGLTSKKFHVLTRIPFGPFLALATLISIFFGEDLIALYLNLMIVKQ